MLLSLLRPRIRPPSLRTTLTLALGEFLRAGSAPRSNSMPAIVVGGIQSTRFSSAPTPLRAGLSLLTSFLTDHHLLPEGRDFSTDACQFASVLHGWQDGVRSVRGRWGGKAIRLSPEARTRTPRLWRLSNGMETFALGYSHPRLAGRKGRKEKGGGSFPPTVVACR